MRWSIRDILFDRARIGAVIERVKLQPLVMRELHEGLRRKSTLRLRKGFGGGSFALLTWILLVWPEDGAGHKVFELFSGLSFFACLVAGIFLGGDSLSKERREGTLPFLFLSSLTSGEVILGKFAAHTLVPAFTLLGVLPAFTVCLLVGGVTGSEIFRTMLAIPATLLWAMSLALLTSSYRSDQRAAFGTAFFAMFILVGSSAATAILGSAHHGWVSFFVAAFSPFALILNANAAYYISNAALFWTSLGITLLTSYGYLAWATAHLSRTWWSGMQEVKIGKSALEQAPAKYVYRRISVGNAIAWLVSRYRAKSIFPVFFPAAAFLIWILTIYVIRVRGRHPSGLYALVPLQLLHIAFKVWIASAATQVFTADRRSGALEMLLGSPLSSDEIALGVVSGLKKRFRLTTGLLLLADLFFAISALQANDIVLFVGSLMLAVLLCVDLYALIWGGLIEGLLAKIPFWGLAMTLWRVVIIPGVIWGALPAIFFGRSVPVALAIWFVLALATTFGALHSMKQRYLPHFRTFAFQFYGEKIPEVESPWSFMNWEEETTGAPALAMGK